MSTYTTFYYSILQDGVVRMNRIFITFQKLITSLWMSEALEGC